MARTQFRRRASKAILVTALAAGSLAVSLAPATVAAAVPPAESSWDVAFADEFDSTALDKSKWHTCHWWSTTTCSIETNKELELYTPNNVYVADGALKLQARQEDAVAWNGSTYNYTSGMVSTGGRKGEIAPGFVFTYGYVEARVKVPKGQGLWPALWLLPNSHAWPPEIDIMEILGHETNVQQMHYLYPRPDGTYANIGTSWAGPDFSADWHTFGVDWSPEAIVWYVDGVERARFSDVANITSEPSYVLLNLAVGGSWPGGPDATTPFPSVYLVDYVRVWQQGTPTTTVAPTTTTTVAPVIARDTVRPSVAISSPREGSRLGSPSATVNARASDDRQVRRIDVLLDGVVKASSSSSSISYTWNTKRMTPGRHVVTVKAYDAASNVGQSAVTVYR